MILVADSGSTKCDWILLKDNQKHLIKTKGFNPFFHGKDLIENELRKSEALNNVKSEVKEIYYYGAGCSSQIRNKVLETALTAFFSNLSILVVKEDLEGAVYATCGNDKGITCILGTGSNSGYYDGQKIHKNFPALGYVLGDEGSGSYFGKKILAEYLYQRLPEDLQNGFKEFANFNNEEALKAVYQKPNANVFLASLMRFVTDNKEHPYLHTMVKNGFKHFAEVHILCFKEYNEVEVNFIGSIAYIFQDVLKEVGAELGFTIGTIIQKPVYALVDYHVKYKENLVLTNS